MAFLITTPDIMIAAATDLASIGSTLNAANAAGAVPTTCIAAAAQDEVSTHIAAVFSQYAGEYQQLSQDMAAFHDKFVQVLNVAAGSYASAEAANVSPLASSANPSIFGLFAGVVAGLFGTFIYRPPYLVGQAWITDPVGEFVDNTLINPIPRALFGRDLIGNGAPGTNGGTVVQAAGGKGGLLFGKGGPGGTVASGQGGPGGAAGLFGNGGTGGVGADGGPGGDGGNGGFLMGIGGAGGAGAAGGVGQTGGAGGPGGDAVGWLFGSGGHGGTGGAGGPGAAGGIGGRGGNSSLLFGNGGDGGTGGVGGGTGGIGGAALGFGGAGANGDGGNAAAGTFIGLGQLDGSPGKQPGKPA
jgi:hypothetical protein